MLHAKKWVDLSHAFDADIPHWKGFDPMTRKVVYDYEKDGFRATSTVLSPLPVISAMTGTPLGRECGT